MEDKKEDNEKQQNVQVLDGNSEYEWDSHTFKPSD